MKISKLLLGFMLVIAIGMLAACGSNNANNSNSDTGVAGESGTEVKSSYKLGALTATSSSYSFYVAVANSIKKGSNDKITVDVVETSASNDNVRLLKRGDIDMGLVTSFTQIESYNGIGIFEDEGPYEELRMFLPNSIQPVPFFVRADANIETIYDLDGKKFNPGTAGSATATSTKLILDTLKIYPKYVEATLDDAIEMVKNKEIVGFAKGSSSVDLPDASVISLSTLIDIQTLGLTKEDADIVGEALPNLTRIVVPANIYDGQPEAIETFGQIGSLASTTKLSEQAGYEIFKAIVENKDMQEEAYPSVKTVDYIDLLLNYSEIPIHAGVVKYLEEIDVEVPEHLKK